MDRDVVAFLGAERTYLPEPTAGYPLTVDGRRRAELEAAHRDLLEAGRSGEALALAQELLEVDPGFHPAAVLGAQAAFAVRRFAAAESFLAPVVGELPTYTAAQLLYGRVAEKLGDLPQAVAAYRAVRDVSAVAGRRAGELTPRAVEILAHRVDEAVARGRLGAAAGDLEQMESWAPDATETLEASRRLAVAREDPEAELAAVTELARRRPESVDLRRRRGQLELEVGDPGRGLQIFQDLAAQHPGDAELAEQLEVAKFLWRLALLPEEVRSLVAQPELSRGDFAVLLYWLVPDVRASRPETVRIATDILDHPQREAIARVANLGLMAVDATLHKFFPDQALRRITALSALLELLAHSPPEPPPCIGTAGPGYSWDSICATASRCLLLGEEAECLPQAGVSGREAVELVRRALKHR